MVVLDGATLTPAGVASVARGGEPVELTADARARNLAARETIAQRLRVGRALYGADMRTGPVMTDVLALLGRGALFRAPFRNSISRACRPTMRSSAAIFAS